MTAVRKLSWQISAVVLLTLASKLAAFGKDALLSFQFGAGASTDAYFIANAIPGLVFAGAFTTIGMVFLPMYQRACEEGESAAKIALHTAAVTYTAISAFLTAFTIILAPVLVRWIAPESAPEIQELAVRLTQILSLAFVFSGWVGLQNAVQQARKQFIWPQIVPFANHLVVIIGLSIAFMIDGGIALLAIAAVVGWVALTPLVTWATRRTTQHTKDEPLGSRTPFSSSIFVQLAWLSLPVFLSQSLDQINQLIGIFIGSSFGTGALSHLTYASRLLILFSSVFGILVSYFIFPYLSESIQKANFDQAQTHIKRGLLLVAMLTMPITITTWFRAPEIISLAFERGAFSQEDAEASGALLKLLSLGIFLIGIREVLNRIYMSIQRTKSLLLFSAVGVATNIAASFYLSKIIGMDGIAIGTILGLCSYIAFQSFSLWHTQFQLLSRDMLLPLLVLALASGTMISWFEWSASISGFGSQFASALNIAIGLIIYATIGFFGAYLIRKQLLRDL